jgi:hypothetical protein
MMQEGFIDMDYNYTMAINQGEPPKPPKVKSPAREAQGRAPLGAPLLVLGWLVCTEGGYIGKDYPIFKNATHIAKNMDMSPNAIGCADGSLHLVIVYDSENNGFSIHREGGCHVKVNGAALEGGKSLKAYDVIQAGGLSLLFMPFCGGTVKWG